MVVVNIPNSLLKDINKIAAERNLDESQMLNQIIKKGIEYTKQEEYELFKELDILTKEAREGKGIVGDIETLAKRYGL
ncbi:hypothetical protein MBCUT_10370 [Methanobrevibacter cuticularis]|uniref:Ribbon-helix-helix protein CopG domain-containing protein n=1 Tax=Methanobrevibacter cuticularis TaxID=47311 RepID=A0A166E1E8_9EURY|nr:hypothetical protein [Methanobrevibacter cuticularis]KZX16171.1 hypothetical protein MBCUT_10370 [Methanobrevibacter cuticularis]